MTGFSLKSEFVARGDQPQAIEELVCGLERGDAHQLLLGATGTGKTFAIANVVARVNRPTLVMCHNKTLAAQLYTEFRDLFPENAVEYFVSYYDYYQPEAYLPTTDTFIEKDSLINDEIDRMRHSATRSLLERNDVLVVASVSCIYGIGAAETYEGMVLELRPGARVDRDAVLTKLVELQYDRNDVDFHRGCFRVRGDVVEVFPVYEDERALRLEWFGDELEAIREVDPLRGQVTRTLEQIRMFPASHYVTTPERRAAAIVGIREELRECLGQLQRENKLVEAQRLEQRTSLDLEMLEQVGMVKGIENYSRHLSGRRAGDPPPTLIDYFPKNFLTVIDESHQTIPQIGSMARGDRARKETLVAYGFRLPSALDNRPLTFDEWKARIRSVIYVSATPADYELSQTKGVVVEQVIRPTGLLDPEVDVRPATHQVDDLLNEIHLRVEKKERVLVTTLTKRMAENLTEHYQEAGIRVRYLHSDIDTLERSAILRELRAGVFDVLIGINLLREGLDLPEVSLVAILDADKEGFLRASRSLIQTIGRAARNANGKVIMYADTVTDSMRRAIDETARRRKKQAEYNAQHGITPKTIEKAIRDLREVAGIRTEVAEASTLDTEATMELAAKDLPALVAELTERMLQKAKELDFEGAAEIRDRIANLEASALGIRSRPRARASRPSFGPRSRPRPSK